MTSIVIVIHVTACIVLIATILVQRGRGGGFIESFAGLESMFGTKTSSFLSKLTTVTAVIFFITCLTLAGLSLRESRSLIRNVKPKTMAPVTANATAGAAEEKKEGVVSQPAAQQAPAAASTAVNQTAN